MHFKRDGLAFHLGHYFTPMSNWPARGADVNICLMFWQALAAIMVIPIVNLVAWGVGLAVTFTSLLIYIWAFSLGFWIKKTAVDEDDVGNWKRLMILFPRLLLKVPEPDGKWIRIEKMPTIFGVKILPAVVALAICLGLLIGFISKKIFEGLLWVADPAHAEAVVGGGFAGSILIFWGLIIYGASRFARSELGRLTYAYAKGVAKNYCPTAKVV